jgi:hypothetical protein
MKPSGLIVLLAGILAGPWIHNRLASSRLANHEGTRPLVAPAAKLPPVTARPSLVSEPEEPISHRKSKEYSEAQNALPQRVNKQEALPPNQSSLEMQMVGPDGVTIERLDKRP